MTLTNAMKQAILSHLPGDHPWQNHIHWFDTIDSTNTRAKQMALAGAPQGTVLIADHQSGGRGRLGRSFQSPGGAGVYMSVILRPEHPAEQWMHLTCAAAVAACDAVEAAAGIRPGIKWTNDLVCGRRKVAGILTELVTVGTQTCVIVGIGVNCCQQEQDFSEDIRSFAGSVAMATGRTIDRAAVAAALITAFSTMDLENKLPMMDRYRRDCITIGRDVSLVRGDEIRHGHAISVDDAGALLVKFDDGSQQLVCSGEISVRGMYGYV